MRVVLDTNVLVRATKNASGPALEALRYIEVKQNGIELLHDVELLATLRESDT